MNVERSQVVAYRVAAQGLHRQATGVDELAILDIGVQDTAPEQARLAFDARMTATPPAELYGPDQPLALVWSVRGAPHVHRRADLPALASALYPLSEADAAGRLNETGASIERAGITALDQFAAATAAMRSVIRAPMAKGAASTAVTERIPRVMWRDCRVCKAHHISDSAMRPAALAAGLELQPGTSPPVLQPWRASKLIKRANTAALQRLIIAYLRLLGPATAADVAGYFGCRRADIAAIWPEGLAEVGIDGRQAWLPHDVVENLRTAPPADLVRLLGGFDPYLQARDRDLIVPDKAAQKALWPVLGRPGAVFVDGEVAGTWRTRASGRKLTVTVEAFAPLPPGVWEQIEAQAQRVADVRGANSVSLSRRG